MRYMIWLGFLALHQVTSAIFQVDLRSLPGPEAIVADEDPLSWLSTSDGLNWYPIIPSQLATRDTGYTAAEVAELETTEYGRRIMRDYTADDFRYLNQTERGRNIMAHHDTDYLNSQIQKINDTIYQSHALYMEFSNNTEVQKHQFYCSKVFNHQKDLSIVSEIILTLSRFACWGQGGVESALGTLQAVAQEADHFCDTWLRHIVHTVPLPRQWGDVIGTFVCGAAFDAVLGTFIESFTKDVASPVGEAVEEFVAAFTSCLIDVAEGNFYQCPGDFLTHMETMIKDIANAIIGIPTTIFHFVLGLIKKVGLLIRGG